MKKLFFLMTLLVWSLALAARVHTVQKGETLYSIAQKYRTTVDNLVAANPGADKLFYVGLKLNIPEPAAAAATPAAPQAATAQAQAPAPTPDAGTAAPGDDDKPATEICGMIEYGFLPKTEGASGSNYTYGITVGANYYFMHRYKGVFAGASIGYNSANYYAHTYVRGYSSTNELAAHFISIPLRVGYAFATDNRYLAITPYAGIDANFCVAAKAKSTERVGTSTESLEMKLKKKVGFDARIGVMLRLWGFNLGAAYVFPLNDGNKMYFGDDSYCAVSIGWGF